MKSCNGRETIPNPTRSRTRDGSTEPSSQISAKREESSRTERKNSGNPRQFKPKNNNVAATREPSSLPVTDHPTIVQDSKIQLRLVADASFPAAKN